MCGFAGKIVLTPGIDGLGDLLDFKENAIKALRRRGPDGQSWQKTSIGIFVHTRLSVVDLAPEANQPFSDDDESPILVFNGEIYNHKFLRKELERQGVKFVTSHSDTECLYRAIASWGIEKALQKISGMYAFAYFDPSLNLLHLTRDISGEKPLFYQVTNSAISFGSTIDSINNRKDISSAALSEYFQRGYICGEGTIFKGIKRLGQGVLETFDLSDSSVAPIENNISLALIPQVGKVSSNSNFKDLLECLDYSVHQMLDCDVPIGVLLSGGIDSSIIASIASRHSTNFKTYTLSFDDSKYDESLYAKKISDYLGIENKSFSLNEENLLDAIDSTVRAFDEPFADPSAIPTVALCKNVRKDVTVALGGDGADELFVGYDRYRFLSKYSRIVLPPIVKGMLRGTAESLHLYKVTKALDIFTANNLRERSNFMFDLNPAGYRFVKSGEYKNFPTDTSGLNGVLIDDFHRYLSEDILVKSDRASMYSSLELRSPFLHASVIQAANNIPLELKLNDAHGKLPLRKILNQFLPVELYERPKMGFSVPINTWFRQSLYDETSRFISDKIHPEINYSYARSLLRCHKSGLQDHGGRIWAFYFFEKWIRANPDRMEVT
ncbi:asparagine synthase (glutamine-hydrolyzing) [Gammaproteobacteria bacterium]|nr:asparagine synthase (glutamine-hydrolyzing) [Gammaproteobacteria bacterium]